jgi:D-3-phosphoglycerate dehydrogenase
LDREVRKGNFGIRYEYLPVDLAGKVLGLLGFGKIGREVAKKAGLGLQMEVQAFDPYLSPSEIEAGGAKPAKNMKALFSSSHVVSIHVPLNEETRGLVGKSLLACMRPDAMLINTSRGGIIDEEALAEALRERRIAGAGIDVFAKEPPSQGNPLLDLPNVVVTPHSSALTKECAAKMATEAVRQTLEVLSGKEPEFVFNREGLKTRMRLKETETDG